MSAPPAPDRLVQIRRLRSASGPPGPGIEPVRRGQLRDQCPSSLLARTCHRSSAGSSTVSPAPDGEGRCGDVSVYARPGSVRPARSGELRRHALAPWRQNRDERRPRRRPSSRGPRSRPSPWLRPVAAMGAPRAGSSAVLGLPPGPAASCPAWVGRRSVPTIQCRHQRSLPAGVARSPILRRRRGSGWPLDVALAVPTPGAEHESHAVPPGRTPRAVQRPAPSARSEAPAAPCGGGPT